jgi:hypothetical protein
LFVCFFFFLKMLSIPSGIAIPLKNERNSFVRE